MAKKKEGPIDLYNSESKPYRKKDKEAYYYLDEKLIKVPKMTDSKEKIIEFLEVCTGQTEKVITSLWVEAYRKNKIILDSLESLRIESSADDTSRWQSIAYAKAIKELKKLEVPIVSGAQAQRVKGIGKGIATVIDEVLRSGELKPKEEREKGKEERAKTIELFTSIWGVDKKLAVTWYDKGYRTLEDLLNADLTDEQKLGIEYIDEIPKPIEREKIEEFNKWCQDNLAKITFGGKVASRIYLTGEYRRGASSIKKIEIVITSASPSKKALEDVLKKIPQIQYISKVAKKRIFFTANILLKLEGSIREAEVTMIPSNIVGAYLIATTGPDSFFQQFREQAAQKEYRLTEEGLYKISGEEDEIVPAKEEEIFKLLGEEYIMPEDRF